MFFSKFRFVNSGLVYYWPFTSDYRDTVQCSVPTVIYNCSFVSDQASPNTKSLFLYNGYMVLRSDVYFSGDFSITSWIKVNAKISRQRLIDCGNGQGQDNIVISISYPTLLNVVLDVYIGSTNYRRLSSILIPNINEWYHLSFTLSQTTMKLYVNGVFESSITNSYRPAEKIRSKCYIGRSNWDAGLYANAYFRDLRIYNRALTDSEVNSLSNN